MFEVAVTCLVLTALLAYLNHRFIGLPTTIGVMGIALLLSFAPFGLDKLGFGALRDSEMSLLSSIDFAELLMQGMLSLMLAMVTSGEAPTAARGALLGRAFRLPEGALQVLTWGGLRGGISVALALSLPNGPQRDLVLALTYAVVVFSILVQRLSTGKVVRAQCG